MKQHILSALREQSHRWENVLATLSEPHITTLRVLEDWTIKDVIAHLWAWQQISIARVEAAHADREPEYPAWVATLHEDWEENANQTNAWVYETYHPEPWSTVYENWREGFLRFVRAGDKISEKDLLDSSRYPWLEGRPLALVLLASYDHHQEHLDKLLVWLQEYANR